MTAGPRLDRSSGWAGIRGVATVVGAIAVLYLARETFIPLAYAITLALIFSPLVGWLQKRGLHRAPAALIVMTLAVVAVAGASYVLFNQLVQVVNELPTYRQTIAKKVKALNRPAAGSLGQAAKSVKELEKELAVPTQTDGAARSARATVPVQLIQGPESVISALRKMIEPFVVPLARVGIVLVFTLFLLVSEADLRNRVLRLAGVGRLNQMTQAFEDATRRVSRYLMLQFLVNAVFGLLCGGGLYLIGVPYAALWGAVAALLRIVPYIGSVVAGLLPLVLCLAVFDGWREPVMVFVLFAALEIITGNFLEPWLYGAHTGISSLALLLMAIFWASLWGPSGLILSTPLTVCAVVLGRHMKQLSFLHILLGDEQVLAPDAQLYQRLLAMDDLEARSIAQEYRRDETLLNLYDQVILPALVMAEQDRHKGALTPEREEFVFLSVREMLAEYTATNEGTAEPRPQGCRVLCIPAHDEADEIAAGMLAQLLDQDNKTSISFPLDTAAQDLLDLVKPGSNDIFCISSVPPFAFTHAKNLSRKLRTRFPQTRILIGIWGYAGDIELAAARFKPVVPDKCVATFREAIEYFTPAAAEAAPVEAKEEARAEIALSDE
ncbi:MAG TPA: AI-2E family transporter [Bryobacteraceae bacterium]|jgi:predicted PurR-regulated permease PerM